MATLAKATSHTWPNIAEAAAAACMKQEELRARLEENGPLLSHSDTSLVVFGSLARQEWTDQSDIDWTLLIDASADVAHEELVQQLSDLIRSVGKPPGREQSFGTMTKCFNGCNRIFHRRDRSR